MDKQNTFVIPVIRPDLIERCLETLYRHTPDNFYVFVIDQTYDGLPQEKLRKQYKDLLFIRPPRNLGFAKATNEGIKLVETPYFTMCNDDVEFINQQWWGGVLAAFNKVDVATPDTPCISVTPSSVKLPDWSLGRPAGDDFYIMPYKENYTDEDYRWLTEEEHYLNEHLTLKPGSVIDGITFYCSVFKTVDFLKTGMLPENYYPGGGEDYWYCCLAYMKNYRAVGTTMSYIFHHWSKSFETIQDAENAKKLIDDSLRHNNNHDDWGENFDVWGMKCSQCGRQLRDDGCNIGRCKDHPDEAYPILEPPIVPL